MNHMSSRKEPPLPARVALIAGRGALEKTIAE
jgi:hypothetical protein